VADPVYQSDPAAAPDDDFEPGALRHLVAGNRGRLLDARRTPIRIVAARPETGDFELEVAGFEDEGAHWVLPFSDIGRFQFEHGTPTADVEAVAEFERARARFDRPLRIDADPAIRPRTLARLAAERDRIREWLGERGALVHLDVEAHIERRIGSEALFQLLDAHVAQRGYAELERELTETLVSNPASGEVVKGYAIVLAELGLCPYIGMAVRDPATFEGARSKEHRAEHLLGRMAFTQTLWTALTTREMWLYRAAATDGALPERAPSSMVSATFSRAVADEHFAGGASTRTAVLWRRRMVVEELLMTFLETRALSQRFLEAEAVLIGDPFRPS